MIDTEIKYAVINRDGKKIGFVYGDKAFAAYLDENPDAELRDGSIQQKLDTPENRKLQRDRRLKGGRITGLQNPKASNFIVLIYAALKCILTPSSKTAAFSEARSFADQAKVELPELFVSMDKH